MNIRSYLRGIGAGMIVTALVMGVANGNSHKMTEAEIISYAKSLGMVESSTLTEMNKAETSTGSVSVIPVSEGNTSVSISISEADIVKEPENKDREPDVTLPVEPIKYETESSETPEPEAINPMPEGEAGFESGEDYVTIKVIKGDSSVSVSRRIFEAGLCESAVELDRYLCQNGYDKSISVGEYKIPKDADFEEIGKIITRRK